MSGSDACSLENTPEGEWRAHLPELVREAERDQIRRSPGRAGHHSLRDAASRDFLVLDRGHSGSDAHAPGGSSPLATISMPSGAGSFISFCRPTLVLLSEAWAYGSANDSHFSGIPTSAPQSAVSAISRGDFTTRLACRGALFCVILLLNLLPPLSRFQDGCLWIE